MDLSKKGQSQRESSFANGQLSFSMENILQHHHRPERPQRSVLNENQASNPMNRLAENSVVRHFHPPASPLHNPFSFIDEIQAYDGRKYQHQQPKRSGGVELPKPPVSNGAPAVPASSDDIHLIFFHNGNKYQCQTTCDLGRLPSEPFKILPNQVSMYERLDPLEYTV